MKKTIRILSLLLALLMLVSTFVACGGGGGNDDEGKKGGETTASTQGGADEVVDKNLPQMNWEGAEYRVLGREYTSTIFQNFEVDRDEIPEDVVGAAVWTRNDTLKSKYGIDVVGTLVNDPTSTAKLFLEAGDDNYDLIITSPEAHHPFAMQGYLVDMANMKYVNLDHEAWNDYVNDSLSMGGKLYYTTNKFLLQDKHRIWAMYYNRELARELNVGYLESEVFDGTWTIDRLIEIAKTCTSEYDGQDGISYNDMWGVSMSDQYCFAVTAFGAGFRLTQKGSDGYPELIGATDKMLKILDKTYELIIDQDSCFTSQVRDLPGENSLAGANIFTDGRAVVMGHCISKIDELTEKTTFEFGLLPNPKLDKDQKDYYSLPNFGNGSLFSIPSTVVDVDFAGFALEAISEESVDTTYHAYIETKCKLQDAFDEDAAKCMDIIFEGVTYDIAFTSDIGGLGQLIYRTMSHQKSNTYGRQFKALSKIVTKEFENIREAYSNIG